MDKHGRMENMLQIIKVNNGTITSESENLHHPLITTDQMP